jgi:hypothetical protein
MRVTPNTTFYNPIQANNLAYDTSVPGSTNVTINTFVTTGPLTNYSNNKVLYINASESGGVTAGAILIVHAASDARLGVV